MSALRVRGAQRRLRRRAGAARRELRRRARRDRLRARPQRRRQDDALPRPAGRARAAGRARDRRRPARPTSRRPSAPGSTSPSQRLDVALMGTLARGRWWLPPRGGDRSAAARRARARRAGGPRGHALRRALRRPAPARAARPRAGAGRPAAAPRRAAVGRRSRPAPTPIAGVFEELRAEGRTLLVSSHDVESARDLRPRALPARPPGGLRRRRPRFSTGATLEATYGSEMIVLEEGGPKRAVTVQHHEHEHRRALTMEFLLEPLQSGIGRRALLEVALVGALLRRARLLGRHRAARLRGRVARARPTAGPRARDDRRARRSCSGRRAGRSPPRRCSRSQRVTSASARMPARPSRSRGWSASARCSPSSRRRPKRLEELLFGDPLGVTDGDLVAAALLLGAGGLSPGCPSPPARGRGLRQRAAPPRSGVRPAAAAARAARPARARRRRGGAGARRAARARRARGPARRRPPPLGHPGQGDAGRGGAGGGGRGRRHRGLVPRRERGRRVGRAGAVRGGGARRGVAYAGDGPRGRRGARSRSPRRAPAAPG